MNWYRVAQLQMSSSVQVSTEAYERSVASELRNLSQSGKQPPDIRPLLEQTKAYMQSIAEQVQGAISRLPDWGGWPVLVRAAELTRDMNFLEEPQSAAIIEVGPPNQRLSFSYFPSRGGMAVGDNFKPSAQGNPQPLQKDYSNLISELRKPGSVARKNKPKNDRVLTRMYIILPASERERYRGAKEIPGNMSVTDSYEVAAAAADRQPVGSKRPSRAAIDIWEIAINSKYLSQMTQGKRQMYLTLEGQSVPVLYLELIDPWVQPWAPEGGTRNELV
jgi:hypothetical protein